MAKVIKLVYTSDLRVSIAPHVGAVSPAIFWMGVNFARNRSDLGQNLMFKTLFLTLSQGRVA